MKFKILGKQSNNIFFQNQNLIFSPKLLTVLILCSLISLQSLNAQENYDNYGIEVNNFKKLFFKVVLVKMNNQKIKGYLEHLGTDSITLTEIKYFAVNEKKKISHTIPATEIKSVKIKHTEKTIQAILKTYGIIVLIGFVADLLTFNSNYFGFGLVALISIIYAIPLAAIIGSLVSLSYHSKIRTEGSAEKLNLLNKFILRHEKKRKKKWGKS